MLEVRGHARGGQGMVTAFEILAKIFSKRGDFQVQAFPAFGVERTGAPIQAFLRVSPSEILNRSNIYHPHFIVVFDESLIDQVPVFDGLNPKGAVLLNTEKDPAQFADKCPHVFTVPATRISLELGLGSKTLPIVNAAMMGAIMRILDGDLEQAKEVIRENVPAKSEANAESAAIAFQAVKGLEKENPFLLDSLHNEAAAEEQILVDYEKLESAEGFDSPYWDQPLDKNKTGNWRLMTPSYVTKPPPCNQSCPAGTDVREFVKLTANKEFDRALDLIYAWNPFPSICGRVCPNFCEQNCNRKEFDEGLNIGAIERFLGDRGRERQVEEAPLHFNTEIAVIGSGPAGLTAALRLREKGYPVTVFEALPHPGGMMRTGIPKFRLPDEVLDREIDRIRARGVRIELNRKVKVEELDGKYAAIVTAIGSHLASPMRIENEDLATEGIRFLREFKLDGNDRKVRRGDQVAIIGGGNTAIDVARTMLRLGAHPTIYYRRTLKEMPAIPQEVEEALDEGVQIEFLKAPTALQKDGNGGLQLTVTSMKLGEPDASGRRRPLPVEGSERTIRVDQVVSAIGQRSDLTVFGREAIRPQQGKIEWQRETPVFCAGDMAWGGTVTEAIGSGNKVAAEVHALLQGLPYHPESTLPEIVLPKDINFAYYMPSVRHKGRVHHSIDYFGDFSEVIAGLDERDIVAETDRCLHCGDCFNCGNCFNYCPDAAIHVDEHGRMRIDYDYCKGCGICVTECPCSAFEFQLIEEGS